MSTPSPEVLRIPRDIARIAVAAAAELNARTVGAPRPWIPSDLLREALAAGLPIVLERRGIGGDAA